MLARSSRVRSATLRRQPPHAMGAFVSEFERSAVDQDRDFAHSSHESSRIARLATVLVPALSGELGPYPSQPSGRDDPNFPAVLQVLVAVVQRCSVALRCVSGCHREFERMVEDMRVDAVGDCGRATISARFRRPASGREARQDPVERTAGADRRVSVGHIVTIATSSRPPSAACGRTVRGQTEGDGAPLLSRGDPSRSAPGLNDVLR